MIRARPLPALLITVGLILWTGLAIAPGEAAPKRQRIEHPVDWEIHGGVTDNASPAPDTEGRLRAIDVGQVTDPLRGEGAEVFHTIVQEVDGQLIGTLRGTVFFRDGTLDGLGRVTITGAGVLSIKFAGTLTITGGTGRYAGASGRLPMSGEQNPVTYGFTATVTGTVTY